MQVANGTSTNGYSAYTSTAVGSGGGMGDQYASLKPLARRIIDFILAQPPTDEGVHVAAIARHVQTDAGSIRYNFVISLKTCTDEMLWSNILL